MTKEQFDQMMAKGLEQAKADDSYNFDEVFNELESQSASHVKPRT